MGAILAGIIQGLGAHAAEQNTINLAAQQKGNEEMAAAFDHMAAQARTPEDQFRLSQMAYTARTKGAKAIPKAQQEYWQKQLAAGVQQQKQAQSQQKQQQDQQNAAAMPTVQQGVTGAPPSPDAQQGANGPVSRPPGGMTSLPAPQGVPPPNPTSAAAPPAPAAAQATQQPAADAPPPVSGLPSPGFASVAPVSLPPPPPQGRFRAPIQTTGGAPLNLRGPEEMQEFAARGAGLKSGAEEGAKYPYEVAKIAQQIGLKNKADIALFQAKWQQAQDFIKQQTGASNGAHWGVKVVNGMPEPYEDNGQELPRVYLGSHIPQNAKLADGVAADPTQTYTLRKYRDGTLEAYPVDVTQRTGFDVNQNPVQYNPYVPGSAAAGGAVAPSAANPKQVNLQGGGVGFVSPGQAAAGAPVTAVPGTIGSGSLVTTSVPGQLPSTVQRGLPAPSQGGAPRAANPSTDNSPVAVNYRDWAAGKATLSDKEQTAARAYAAKNGLPVPDQLSSSGLKAVAVVQPVLDEIIHARKLLKDSGLIGMSELHSKVALGKAFAKYKYGRVDDPLAKAISDLSFDRIRSVGQALAGTSSRAQAIFQMGLEHTPVIGLNSDSGKLMDDKLAGMERRAREAIDAARTETKSGISAPGVTPPTAPLPAGVPNPGETFGGGKVLKVERVQ